MVGSIAGFPQLAWAGASFQFSPGVANFQPVGRGSTQSFRVTSTGTEPVAVELRMAERQVAPDGTETHPDAEDDFLIFPPQLLLNPGQSQTVRVTWVGDPEPGQELAYRIIADQLPINLEERTEVQNGIQVAITVAYRYVNSVYVTPRGAQPDVQLTQAVHRKGSNGEDQLVVTFVNQGTARTSLNNLNLHLSAAGDPATTVHLKPEQLNGINGENMLAGLTREVVLPWPQELPVGPLHARFESRS